MNEQQFIQWMRSYAAELHTHKDMLTELDSAIGDGDHGLNMDRGFQAVLTKLEGPQSGGIGGIAKTVATTLISTVGGASGPLYSTFFLKAAVTLTGKTECTALEFAAALEKGAAGIQALGKAQRGDKTMLDAIIPAVEAFKKAAELPSDFSACVKAAAKEAKKGMEATIPIVARKGRASYLGERSAGHQDPGATSAYLFFKTGAEVL